jgi:hypothetical protein
MAEADATEQLISTETASNYARSEEPYYEWRMTLFEYEQDKGVKKTFGLTVFARTLERAQDCAIRLMIEQWRDSARPTVMPHTLAVHLRALQLKEHERALFILGLFVKLLHAENWTKKHNRVETGWFVRTETAPAPQQTSTANEQKEMDSKK